MPFELPRDHHGTEVGQNKLTSAGVDLAYGPRPTGQPTRVAAANDNDPYHTLKGKLGIPGPLPPDEEKLLRLLLGTPKPA